MLKYGYYEDDELRTPTIEELDEFIRTITMEYFKRDNQIDVMIDLVRNSLYHAGSDRSFRHHLEDYGFMFYGCEPLLEKLEVYYISESVNGAVSYGSKTYALIEQPLVENYGTDGEVRFYANAIDLNGELHDVTWETLEDYDSWEDACDWEKPYLVVKNMDK
jgi:hypothetical protein